MKRHLLNAVVVIITFSCNSNYKNENNPLESNDLLELDTEVESYEDKEYIDYDYLDVTQRKLQELYDLSRLENQHPEYSESIAKKLEDLLLDENKFKNADSVSIKNIVLLDSTRITDSIKKIHIEYEAYSISGTKKEIIYATIFTKNISMDGKVTKSFKIKFSRQK